MEEAVSLEFREVVTSEAELRRIVGEPSHRVLRKQIATLDHHCRAFIAKCPFLLVSSCDASGNMDVSPKGDPAGFVQVLDDRTLAIPDRPGNRRADTFRNLLQNPRVGLLLLVPGKPETLRINGSARIVRDEWLRSRMAVGGRLPELALVVEVSEVFFHCAKCAIRSGLWQTNAWPKLDGLASLAEVLVDQGRLNDTREEMQALIDESVRERLY